MLKNLMWFSLTITATAAGFVCYYIIGETDSVRDASELYYYTDAYLNLQ